MACPVHFGYNLSRTHATLVFADTYGKDFFTADTRTYSLTPDSRRVLGSCMAHKLLTIEQAATELGVSVEQIKAFMAEGRLKSATATPVLRIASSDVDRVRKSMEHKG